MICLEVLRAATFCRYCEQITFIETSALSVFFWHIARNVTVVVVSALTGRHQGLYPCRRLDSGPLVKGRLDRRPRRIAPFHSNLSRHFGTFVTAS